MIEAKFDVGSKVRIIHHPDNHMLKFIGTVGTVTENIYYHKVKFDSGEEHLFIYSELELVTGSGHVDVTGREINVGDTIVYFTRHGSSMFSQKAKVEFIGTKSKIVPHIRVLREDAVEKNKFTRKAWLWSFDNSVKIG